jgi:hypothetical protein
MNRRPVPLDRIWNDINASQISRREVLRKAVESEYEVPTETGGTRTATLIDLYGIDETKWLPKWHVAADKLAESVQVSVAPTTGIVNLAVGALDPHLAGLGKLTEHRRVAGQHAQLPLGGPGDDHLGLAIPDLLLDCHQLHMQLIRHCAPLRHGPAPRTFRGCAECSRAPLRTQRPGRHQPYGQS